MNAIRLVDADATSGTFETRAATTPAERYAEAHRLAGVIEQLLTPASADESQREPYGARITRALARSLLDALHDLNRDTARASKIA
jgi:hypothetical protein